MSPITSSTFAFCPPPPGKPDPTQPRPSQGLDTRTRVVQLGTKGNTCWYAAFNLLRERYKAPNTENLPERAFEKLASSLRKSLSVQGSLLPNIINELDTDLVKKYLKRLTKEEIATPETQKMLKELDSRLRKPQVPLNPVIPDFLKQEKYENLYDYLVYLTMNTQQDSYNQFFDKLKENPRDLFENAKKLDQPKYQSCFRGKDWEDLDCQHKTACLSNFARQLIAKQYNMKLSSWHPSQPIGHLIDELQKRGPLIVAGYFGAARYDVPAKNLPKKIEDRAVYGWVKTDPKKTNPIMAHVILLVGVEKTSTRGFVYYIDPTDKSDPSRLETQKIYCMSYKTLTSMETIIDNHGFLRNDAPNTIGYALYQEKSIHQENVNLPIANEVKNLKI